MEKWKQAGTNRQRVGWQAMKHTNTNCKMADDQLANLLLDTHRVPAKVQAHVAECGDCQGELRKLEAAMQLLDTWEAPLHVRPLAAMALTVVLLLGGGTYLGVTDWMQPAQPTPLAATVNDLQILDSNAQVLDQMESLSTNSSGD